MLGRFWRSSSTLTSNEGLSSSEAELRSMRNNGQTKLMNRFMNWSKIFNNKERAGTLPTPGTSRDYQNLTSGRRDYQNLILWPPEGYISSELEV